MLEDQPARAIAADPVRVGVIGTGTIARAVHLPLLARGALTEVVTVSDIDRARASRVASTYGARARTTLEVLTDPGVEAVLITTPGDHVFLAEAALQRGKHVLAEKPLAFAEDDARRLGALALERGLVLQVGYMKAFDPVMAPFRDASARVGAQRVVEVRVRHPADAPQTGHLRLHLEPASQSVAPADAEDLRAAEERDRRAVRAAIGEVPESWHRLYRNVLCGSLIHELALMRAAGLGLPILDAARLSSWEPPMPPTITASGRFPSQDEPAFQMVWAWLQDFPEYQERLELTGTAGSARLDVASPYLLDEVSVLTELTMDPTTSRSAHQRRVLGRDGAFQRQLEGFAMAVRSPGAASVPGAAEAVEDIRWLQRLFALLAETNGQQVGGEARNAAA